MADEPADTAGAIPVAGPGHASVLTGTTHGSILTTGSPALSDPAMAAGGYGQGSSPARYTSTRPAKSEDEKAH
jgi:hypothetical protein